MEEKYKILIVDDEQSILDMLKLQLEFEGYSVYTAGNAAEALDKLSYSPDIVLLDINMDGMNGLDLCVSIRDFISCPIIFLTARVSEQDKINGLMAGGDDYITKPFNPLELVARVKSNLRRYTQLGSLNVENNALYQVGGLCMNDDTKEVTVDGEPVKLTPIEYNILFLLVKNQGKVFSIDQIYENIWNEEAIGADNTVAVHIRHIREKIEINPKEPRYLKVVWGVGYKVEKQ